MENNKRIFTRYIHFDRSTNPIDFRSEIEHLGTREINYITSQFKKKHLLVTSMEPSEIETNQNYIIVRSASSVLASAANKLSSWVSLKMEDGWAPHGPPQMHHDGEMFYLIQSMVK